MHVTRRRFLLGAAAAAVTPLVLPVSAFSIPAVRRGTFTPIRRNVGTFEDRGGTIGWLATRDAVVVVDSQFADSAAECRDGLRAREGRAVDYLLNTHHHGDHTSGNSVFAGEAELVAHANVPGLQRAAAERNPGSAPPVTAGTVFDDEWTVDLGNERIRMAHYGPAHTGGDAIVHFEQADVVHMGDLVFNRRPPVVDIAGGASVAAWIDLLERVHHDHTDDTVFIYGHANPTHGIVGTREDLLVMRDFLTAMIEFVRQEMSSGTPSDSIAATRVLPGFESHFLADRPDGLGRSIRSVMEEVGRNR